MTISLHRLTRTFMEFLSCCVHSSFPEQGVTSYSSYTLQRCVTLSMRDLSFVAHPVSWEWPQQMLQSAASSRTWGKGGQPSAVRDEGGDTRVYPGSAPRRVKTY